ncbi:MAG TPA: DUF4350 domain-containing protein [Spirochaetota bacterium]|nr:DUF4350 domain-containing protein [Spirochaetota bacterium]HPP50968.1 DUF4350 domain-containing protein [Spirochaetota bacterium]
MKRILFILLFIISCSQKYTDYTPFTIQLIYDQSHNNVWGLWDHGYCGYSHIAGVLKQHGIPASVNLKKLDECISSLPSMGYSNAILMLSVAKYQRFDDREIDAISNFVNAGGLLFVIAEHDNMYNSATFLNAVTHKMGITINSDAAGKDNDAFQSLDDLNNRAYSKKFKLKNVLHMLSASLSGTADSFEVLLRDDETDNIIAGGCRYGKGKMLVVGDSEMFWNGDGKVGIHAGDNSAFFKHCIEWLLEKHLAHTVQHAVTVPCFDAENSYIAIDKSPSGVEHFINALTKINPSLLHDDSINIIVIPMPNCGINNTNRNIIFIEPYQKLIPSTVWGKRLIALGAVNTKVYSFLGDSNCEILPCLITDGDTNFFDVVISCNKKRFYFHRLAGMIKKGNGGVIAQIPSSLWGEVSHPGLEVLNDGIPLYQPNDYETAGFVYADKNLLVVGDADAIANQNRYTETYKEMLAIVMRWIKTGNID